MSMLSQTYIGKYYEGSQELSVSTKSIPGQDNDSYVILGESGYGKSVAAQSIVLQKANQSYRVRSIDIHDSSAPEHLFPTFRKSFEQLSSRIDAYNTPIPTTLFEPLHYADGTMESPADLSYTLSNIIANHLRLSRSSTAALSEALEYAISDRDNNPDIFPAVLKALEEFDTKASRNAMAYLAPLLRHNIFRHQSVNYSFGIENISLSKFPPLFKNVIVDLLLFDEFRTASQGGQPPRYIYIDEMQNLSIDKDCYLGKILTEGRKYSLNVIVDLLLFDEFRTASQGGQPPRYIYIDEMQNLSIDKDCYLGKILTEGRKYSLNVILASQSIREFNASERTMLCQANHKLLFHPALLEVKYYAELLASPQHRAEISDLLRNLEVGQCVFQGPIYIGEDSKPTRAPICVNVSHLEDIASASLSKSST